MDQTRAPLYDALEAMRSARIVPFDVPGHKRGRGNKPLTEFLGERCLSVDVNSMKPLDNLCHPVSVIKEAEALAAAMTERPPLTARTNTLKLSRDDLKLRLAAEGVASSPCRHSPLALSIDLAGSVEQLPSFREGLFTIQDEIAAWIKGQV